MNYVLVTEKLRIVSEKKRAIKSLWKQACEHDGIPVDSQFATFSDGNPHAEALNVAMIQLQEFQRSL